MAKSKPLSDAEISVIPKLWKEKDKKNTDLKSLRAALATQSERGSEDYMRKFFTKGPSRRGADDHWRTCMLNLLDIDNETFQREAGAQKNCAVDNGTAVSATASLNEMERDHRRCSNEHEYEKAADIAGRAIALCAKPRDAAIWAARAGAAHRTLGQLFDASDFYGQAQSYIAKAQKDDSSSTELQFLSGQIDFGRIMVDDFHRFARFDLALRHHGDVLATVERFLARIDLGEADRREAKRRRPHPIRQQAEMLRYMGRYDEAIVKIAEAKTAYPDLM